MSLSPDLVDHPCNRTSGAGGSSYQVAAWNQIFYPIDGTKRMLLTNKQGVAWAI